MHWQASRETTVSLKDVKLVQIKMLKAVKTLITLQATKTWRMLWVSVKRLETICTVIDAIQIKLNWIELSWMLSQVNVTIWFRLSLLTKDEPWAGKYYCPRKYLQTTFFPSATLVLEVLQRQIYFVGILHSNNLACQLEHEKSLAKKDGGSVDARMEKEELMTIVKWYHITSVTLISSYCAGEPQDKAWGSPAQGTGTYTLNPHTKLKCMFHTNVAPFKRE